jgi:hypothetical protein
MKTQLNLLEDYAMTITGTEVFDMYRNYKVRASDPPVSVLLHSTSHRVFQNFTPQLIFSNFHNWSQTPISNWSQCIVFRMHLQIIVANRI